MSQVPVPQGAPRQGLGALGPGSARRSAGDVLLVLLLVGAVVAISASAPVNTYAYSQIRWTGVVLGAVQQGNWLLPRNHFGEVPHKPQLYLWLEGAVLKLTGAYNDFVFRLPTVAASLVAAVLVYWLARRWYGRRVGLLATCLWVTMIHMSKMMYIATTDMLLTMWIVASVVCVDRLLFHPAPRRTRLRWAVGLWVTMILGALTKGWGVVNPVLVGAMVALATAVRPGFGALRTQAGMGAKAGLTLRLIARRWWRACKAVHLGWGLLAMALVLVPVWIGMFMQGGQQFRDVVREEIWNRLTGQGSNPPDPSSTPAALNLFYYTLPASVFAIGAMFLPAGPASRKPGRVRATLRRWFARRSPLSLPMCWILGVLLPFMVAHGFRPDYLLPCYAAVAMMGAWAVEAVHLGRLNAPRTVRVLRHVFAGAAVVVALALILGPIAAAWYSYMPRLVRKALRVPPYLPTATWWALCALIPAGVAALVLAVRASLRWQIRGVAGVAVAGMLGVAFLSCHVYSRHAYSRDGEKLLGFARQVRQVIGSDRFAVYRAERMATELYLGRFGTRIGDPFFGEGPKGAIDLLNRRPERWLITCDRGLIELGAAKAARQGSGCVEVPVPGQLGWLRVVSPSVSSRGWGQLYLIELRRPIHVSGRPRMTEDRSDKSDDAW